MDKTELASLLAYMRTYYGSSTSRARQYFIWNEQFTTVEKSGNCSIKAVKYNRDTDETTYTITDTDTLEDITVVDNRLRLFSD